MSGGAERARYSASTGSSTSRSTVDTAGTAGTAGTGTGTGTLGGSSAQSVRRVRLARPPSRPCGQRAALGFSVRGGREHGTGFFVSRVDPESEADLQGLRVGDQVVRVNGFRLGDALHQEVLGLISGLNHLRLKVRNVGMIPVKEKVSDPLTWRMVPETVLYAEAHQRPPSPPSISKEDTRLTLLVPSRAKLGCGICKGPDWKPGIFVQFTKENGIAREAGLRPGDQIMQCNGIDFREIQFSDAVALMKQSRRLDFRIRPGAGRELFPGESSGYNSSASSNTGDQSPSSADHKRLSIVKEETMDLEDRLSQLDGGRCKRKNWDHHNFEWDIEQTIKENEAEFINEINDLRRNTCLHKPNFRNIEGEKEKLIQNRTIINLSENGTTIQNNYVLSSNENENPYNTYMSSVPLKTVTVDVHRSEKEFESRDKSNITNIECEQENKIGIPKVPSSNSIVSLTNSTASSLSNAITQEFQRRAERMKNTNFNVNQIDEMKKNKIMKSVDDDKKQKHDALMDEFKKAHKRMFANNCAPGNNGLAQVERLCTFTEVSGRTEKEVGNVRSFSMYTGDRPFNAYNGTTTTPRVQNPPSKMNGAPSAPAPAPAIAHAAPLEIVKNFKPPGHPPPPPPMPIQDNKILNNTQTPKIVHKSISTKPKAPPPPPVKKVIQNGNGVKHASEGFPDRPPSTPTPDYDTSSLVKVTSKIKLTKSKSDAVDMESLESFKLNNPSSPTPRPPSTYFMKQQNGTLTMKKSNPNVSVTIGEYPTNTFRKQPSRLGFLNGDATDGKYRDNEPAGSRLQSELVQTLSRSNLKKKTEPETIVIRSESQIKTFESPLEPILPSNGELNENFNKRYGQTVLPQPPQISIPKVPIGKSLSHNTLHSGFNDANPANKYNALISNGKEELTKTESLPQNGILKHANPMFIHDRNTATQHKSIKFGQITTVIGDPEIPVMVNH